MRNKLRFSLIGLSTLLMLLEQVNSQPRRMVTVGVDARGVADGDFARFRIVELQRKLALRLTQVGYAVIAPDRGPVVTVVVRVVATDSVQLVVGAREVLIHIDDINDDNINDISRWHWEVVHKAIEAVRRVESARGLSARQPQQSNRASVSAPADAELPDLRVRRAAAGPVAESRIEFAAGAGMRVQRSAIDPRVQLVLYGRVWRQLWLYGSGDYVFSSGNIAAVAARLTVHEWGLCAGAQWRFLLGRNFDFALGAAVGFVHHLYRFSENSAAAYWGGRIDPAGTGTATVGYRMFDQWRLSIDTSAHLSGERTHVIAGSGQTLWRAWPIGLSIGAQVGFLFY